MQQRFNMPYGPPPVQKQPQPIQMGQGLPPHLLRHTLPPIPTKPIDFKASLSSLDNDTATKFSQALMYWSESKTSQQQSSSLDSCMAYAGLDPNQQAIIKGALTNYNLTILGGGNSKNFLLENRNTGQKEVLKLESRFGNPIDEVKRVQANLQTGIYANTITRTEAEKSVIIFNADNKQQESRILQVTEYCPGSDLDTAALNCKSTDEVLNRAGSIYSQMSGFLVALEKNGSGHTDMKNSNWLLDDKGNLKVADTKAIIPTQKYGIISRQFLQQQKYCAPSTDYINPPEFSFFYDTPGGNPAFDAGRAESFMFGRNLYGFLTARTNQDPYASINDASRLDFSDPIFNTFEGSRYKLLIQNTVRYDINSRMTLTDVEKAMAAIQTLKNQDVPGSTKEQCFAQYNELHARLKSYPPLQGQEAIFLKRFNDPYLDLNGLIKLESDMKMLNQSIKIYEAEFKGLLQKYTNDPSQYGRYSVMICNSLPINFNQPMTIDDLQRGIATMQVLKNQDNTNLISQRSYEEYQKINNEQSRFPGLQRQSAMFFSTHTNPALNVDGMTKLLADMQLLNQAIKAYDTQYDSLMKKHEKNPVAVTELLRLNESLKSDPNISAEALNNACQQLDNIKVKYTPSIPKRADIPPESPDFKSRFRVMIGEHRQEEKAKADIEQKATTNKLT